MAVEKINRHKCRGGCSICIDSCWLDVLRLDSKSKAYIAYPDECDSCFWCTMSCPAEAISVSAGDTLPWINDFFPTK
jgi:NAD-dependent dihydropyrimidine dehydrogenase PreA subunit